MNSDCFGCVISWHKLAGVHFVLIRDICLSLVHCWFQVSSYCSISPNTNGVNNYIWRPVTLSGRGPLSLSRKVGLLKALCCTTHRIKTNQQTLTVWSRVMMLCCSFCLVYCSCNTCINFCLWLWCDAELSDLIFACTLQQSLLWMDEIFWKHFPNMFLFCTETCATVLCLLRPGTHTCNLTVEQEFPPAFIPCSHTHTYSKQGKRTLFYL